METRKAKAAEYRLQLRAAELEYEQLQIRAQDALDATSFPGRALVADFVEANLGLIEGRPLATEYAVRLRDRNCKYSGFAIYGCWIAAVMFAAAAAVLGFDKQLLPAIATAGLGCATGKIFPEWINARYLKPEEKRLERWQKLRASALATLLKNAEIAANDVTPRRRAGERWP